MHQWNLESTIESIRALMDVAKGADWANLEAAVAGLRTLMEDAREGLIR